MRSLFKLFKSNKVLKPTISRVASTTVVASVAMGVSHCSN